MVPLFYSQACDWCDGSGHTPWKGWAAVTKSYDLANLGQYTSLGVYVFYTERCAQEWKKLRPWRASHQLIQVYMSTLPIWCVYPSYAQAEEIYDLKKDHRHPPLKEDVGGKYPVCWPVSPIS